MLKASPALFILAGFREWHDQVPEFGLHSVLDCCCHRRSALLNSEHDNRIALTVAALAHFYRRHRRRFFTPRLERLAAALEGLVLCADLA